MRVLVRQFLTDACYTTTVLTLRSRPIVSWAATDGPILAARHVYRGTRSLRRERIARVGLWRRYHVVGAAPLAPRSGPNDLITLQNRWSGAGSNRRPSAFQAHPQRRCVPVTGGRGSGPWSR